MYSPSIEKLIESFEKLPSIGHKTAQRLAFHILESSDASVNDFVNSILNAKQKIKFCKKCFNITENEYCDICMNPKRKQDLICVVEDVRDIAAMEKTHEFDGLYHVLHGSISPLNGVTPDDLKIKELIQRIGQNEISEVILATNPRVEGEATAIYISKILKPMGIKTTRIAHGLPIGGDLEYADEITLTKALEGRREL